MIERYSRERDNREFLEKELENIEDNEIRTLDHLKHLDPPLQFPHEDMDKLKQAITRQYDWWKADLDYKAELSKHTTSPQTDTTQDCLALLEQGGHDVL